MGCMNQWRLPLGLGLDAMSVKRNCRWIRPSA